ncbi:MAG: RHS repeat-associated core domain-containing protein [Bacteroidetes bacterium]|nr:RHS repeat-associated core domain-containing protein [Bacteroidota bacterium]
MDDQLNNNYNDAPWMGEFLTGAWGNVQNYTQEYSYDAANNMTQLKHNASSQAYTRDLVYNTNSNQLQSSTVGSSTMNYTYDAMGNMINLPHLSAMDYNHSNQLSHILQGTTTDTYYQYDASGNRTRKYTTKAGGIVEERIYLGECEIFRTFTSSSLTLERTTMHVSDGSGRIAMLEVRTVGSDAAPAVLRRYIYSNHLQTASLELDENRDIISYEEYHAFGTTAYQLTNASINAIAKRYKYAGKEKDEESGLHYHGARYYIPWLCRWSQCDPIGIKDGLNTYAYCSNNPVMLHDPSGKAADENKKARKAQNFNSESLANESSFVKGDTLTDSKGNVRNYLEDEHRFESPDEASKHNKSNSQGAESKQKEEHIEGQSPKSKEAKPSESIVPDGTAGSAPVNTYNGLVREKYIQEVKKLEPLYDNKDPFSETNKKGRAERTKLKFEAREKSKFGGKQLLDIMEGPVKEVSPVSQKTGQPARFFYTRPAMNIVSRVSTGLGIIGLGFTINRFVTSKTK